MAIIRILLLVATSFVGSFSHSAPRGDLWCASLLADPGGTSPVEFERLRKAILVPFGIFGDIRHDVYDPDSWRSNVRETWRGLTARTPPRLRLDHRGERKVSRKLARALDLGHDRLKAAHNETFSKNFASYPVRRLAVGADEIRSYLAEVRGRAEDFQSRFEALPQPAVPLKTPVRGGRLVGSAVGTFFWSGAAAVVMGATVGAMQMHWWHAAAAVGFVGGSGVGYKLVPRYRRLYLHVRGAYAGVVGLGGPIGPREFSIEQMRLMDEIEAILADPHASRDTVVYSASTVEFPLGTEDEGDEGAGRASPTSDQLIAAVHARGWAPVPVDARRFESDLAFFFDSDGRPTLFSILREPGYLRDRR